jgi:hypothetical protein
MLNKLIANKHSFTRLSNTSMRAFSNGTPSYAKDKIAHATGLKEEVRPEFTQMYNDLEMLVGKSMPMIKQYYDDCGKPYTTKINNFALPPEIIEKLGPLTNEGHSFDECIRALETTMKYSVNTLNPFFFDKLYAGSDPIGQIAELIVTVLNTGTHVYNCSPVFSIMEMEVMTTLAKQYGFDTKTADGVSNPGGTMSNMMAVLLARNEYFPHVRGDGWKAEDKPIAFTSRQSHYSVNRGAMVSGMGMNNMKQVPCDRWTGAMNHEALEE